MRLDALWHDLECGAYDEDLPLWRALAGGAGGPVLDVGAGTRRVSLDLAAGGFAVVALDADPSLPEALEHRAAPGDPRHPDRFALAARLGWGRCSRSSASRAARIASSSSDLDMCRRAKRNSRL